MQDRFLFEKNSDFVQPAKVSSPPTQAHLNHFHHLLRPALEFSFIVIPLLD